MFVLKERNVGVEMEYVLIIHEVEDYTVWKKIFDDAAII